MAPKVLMVAEKPSIALAIASALSGGRMSTRRGSTEVHEFDGMFLGFPVHYKVTSVIGHVFRKERSNGQSRREKIQTAIQINLYCFYENREKLDSVDFPARFQDWSSTNPLDLFDAPIVKSESTPKAHICRHLSQEARGCGHLVLWLDCDREGENICFEVIECTGFQSTAGKKVHRARFSSVTEKDILKAMNSLVEPNKNEAQAVDARQEIDLKVGVAFTRFQTSYFNGKYGNLDSRVISYGPCQTPTLGFCVRRHLQINTFKPEKFWTLHPYIMFKGYELKLDWQRHRLFDSDVTQMFRHFVKEDGFLKVIGISEKQVSKGRPTGLNTVNLLKVASSALGFGPQLAMQLAERLYTQGFISYPRTESTAYPASFDYKGTLGALARNPVWGDYVQQLLSDGYHKPRSGTDAGDHPPITPMSSATENILGHDAWKLYQYICQHFLGTLSPDCKYTRIKIEFESGGESFNCVGQHVLVKGFTSIMPWLAVTEINIPQFTEGQKIDISRIEVDEVQAGRRLVPTALGISLIRGYQLIDPDLCLPDIRSFIEHQIALVAKGQADHSLVVEHDRAV
ncbi:UNVERIFIED_CONTAM: DNA topoisomerase 3-beta [Sesamum latifolium]|uniref:DNA topoisomerase n=1 Tax=Sesamum latifolium TaxID=2727402 RepID=A0AAW2VUK7_9LAMI